jgi:hypothetical protein
MTGGQGPVDISGFAVGGEYNFEDVDAGSSPLGEAAFLGKSSDIHLVYSAGTIESAVDIDLTVLDFGIEYFVTDVISVGLDLNSYELDPGTGDETISSTVLSGGYYMSDTTRVGLSLSQGEHEDTSTTDSSGIGLEIKTLIDDSYSLFAEYETTSFEAFSGDLDIITLNIGGMYYLSQTTGIGAQYSTEDNEIIDDESSTIALNGQYFINDDSYVEASYSTTSYDVDPDDSDLLAISYNMRF